MFIIEHLLAHGMGAEELRDGVEVVTRSTSQYRQFGLHTSLEDSLMHQSASSIFRISPSAGDL